VKTALSPTTLLKGIRDGVLEVRYNFDILQIYRSPKTRKQYWRVLTAYENFFSTGQRAHFIAMVVALGRVFDDNPKNVCIKALLDTAPDFEKIETNNLNSACGLWNGNVSNLRHAFAAHHGRPAPIMSMSVSMRASMTLARIERLIRLCETVVTAWMRHARCQVQILSGSKGHTLELLDQLLKGLD
jgi:AbiU2